MFEITDHIEYLLTEHDCVVVPGLGAFLQHYSGAVVLPEEGILLPPSKQLKFNASLLYDDGLLVSSLTTARPISREEAEEIISREVSAFKNELLSGGNICFGKMGIFHLAENSTMVFEQNKAFLFDLSTFGLQSLNIKPLPLVDAVSDPIQESQEKSASEAPRNKDVIYIPIHRNFIRRMAAAAAVIITLMMISTPIDDSNVQMNYAGIVSSELFGDGKYDATDKAPEFVLNESQPAILADSVSVVDSKMEVTPNTEPTESSINNETQSEKYLIIVSSLPNVERAKQQMEMLSRQGIKENLLLYDSGTKVRLYVKSFSEIKDAETYLSALRERTPEFADAWIYKVK